MAWALKYTLTNSHGDIATDGSPKDEGESPITFDTPELALDWVVLNGEAGHTYFPIRIIKEV